MRSAHCALLTVDRSMMPPAQPSKLAAGLQTRVQRLVGTPRPEWPACATATAAGPIDLRPSWKGHGVGQCRGLRSRASTFTPLFPGALATLVRPCRGGTARVPSRAWIAYSVADRGASHHLPRCDNLRDSIRPALLAEGCCSNWSHVSSLWGEAPRPGQVVDRRGRGATMGRKATRHCTRLQATPGC